MNELEQLQEIFLEETSEYVTELNETLLALEQNKNDPDLLQTLFRIMHTLKSSAAAMGYKALSQLSHKSESLLQKVRDENLELTSTMLDILFKVADQVNALIKDLNNGEKKDYNYDDILTTIENLDSNSKKTKKTKKKKETKTATNGKPDSFLTKKEEKQIQQAQDKGESAYLLEVEIDEREPMMWLRAELLLNNITKIGTLIGLRPNKEKFLLPDFDGKFTVIICSSSDEQSIIQNIKIDLLKKLEIKPLKISSDTPKKQTINKKIIKKQYDTSLGKNTIRVSIDKLNELMNLSGELVVATSGLRLLEKKLADANLQGNLVSDITAMNDKVSNLIFELQSRVMQIRMVPVSQLFLKFHRIIRDIAKEEKKKIKLVLSGEETELDKNLIDSISEAMMHLVRNAIDHGIETPSARTQKGKSEEGTILMSATQTGNHIVLTVRDDGEGINLNSIKQKAIQKGLLTKEKADDLTKEELIDYLFEPGFSTSDEVTSISGRGVGLDVVKSVLESMSGTIEVHSELHQFTEFRIMLPLTLASTSVILVQENQQLFAIPIKDIEETIKIDVEKIQTVEGSPVIQLRDEVLPLIYLSNIFNIFHKADYEKLSIVVVKVRGKKMGLVVAQILRKEEIVLKSLSESYKAIQGIAGGSVLGDGSIVLVLDTLPLWDLMKKTQSSITKGT